MKRRAQQKNKDCHHPYILRKGPILHFFSFSHSYHRKKEDKNEVAIKVLSSPKKAVSEHQMASMASRSGNGFFPLRVAKLSKRPLFPHFNVHTTTDYYMLKFSLTLFWNGLNGAFVHVFFIHEAILMWQRFAEKNSLCCKNGLTA